MAISFFTLQVHYLVSRWGTDPNSLGCYSYDIVGKPADLYERLRAPVGNLFFGGEAMSLDEHQGSVHGAYAAGLKAADDCERHLLKRLGSVEKVRLASFQQQQQQQQRSPKAAVPLQISRM